MLDFEKRLASIAQQTILCVGDLMLDDFVYGEVGRISPEAPAPVLAVTRNEMAIGGAGNVARNIASLGARCIFVGLVGEDEAGREVIAIGVLSIRPAVRSGPFIGVIDELGVAAAAGRSGSAAPAADAAQLKGLGDSILEHLVTSARNKGCTRVDVTDPLATAEPALLKRAGFERRGALLSRAIG